MVTATWQDWAAHASKASLAGIQVEVKVESVQANMNDEVQKTGLHLPRDASQRRLGPRILQRLGVGGAECLVSAVKVLLRHATGLAGPALLRQEQPLPPPTRLVRRVGVAGGRWSVARETLQKESKSSR